MNLLLSAATDPFRLGEAVSILMKSDSEKIFSAEKCRDMGRRCVCFNLRKAARAVTQLYDSYLRPSGLRGTQLTLLMAARGVGPVQISRLAKGTIMDRTTLTRNLRVLERKKLITIKTGLDRRAREIALTDRGHDVLMKAMPLWGKAQAYVQKGIGGEVLKRFLEDLSKFVSLARKD